MIALALKEGFAQLTAEATSTSDFLNPRLWLLDAFAGRATTSGERVDPIAALGISAYYACCRNIAEDIGKIPLLTYKRRPDGRGKDRATDHRVFGLLRNEANPEMGARLFKELLTFWAVGWGNGYAEIVWDNAGRVSGLYPIHPANIQPRRRPGTNELYYKVTATGRETLDELLPGQVLHIRGVGGDPDLGWSVARLACERLGEGLALQKFGAALFANGLNKQGVLTSPIVLSDEAIERLRNQWATRHQGAGSAHKPLFLEQGMEFKETNIPPNEAQWLESRQFLMEETASWFRMPLEKIQRQIKAKGWNSTEQENTNYLVDCLLSWECRWEEEVWLKLFLLSEQEEYFSEFLNLGLLRGDSKARIEYYKGRRVMGTASANDIREWENENPIDEEGADMYFIEGNNMIPLSMAAKGVLAKTPLNPPAAQGEVLGPVFLDAARRVVAKENRAVARLVSKGQGVEEFYAGQEDYIVSAFWPAWGVAGRSLEDLRLSAKAYCWERVNADGSEEATADGVLEALGILERTE